MSNTTVTTPYDNESRVPNVIAAVAGTLAIGTITTVARLYTRAFIVKSLGIDDWFALFSLLFSIGCGLCIALNTQYGIGRHIWTIDMTKFPLYLKIFYVSIVMYGAAITAIKATFLLQYQRVFAVGSYINRFFWALVIVMGWSIASLIIAIFSCNPVEGFWDASVPAYCIPEHPWWEINSAGNVITDFAVFCLPLPTLWKLRLPKGQKIALIGIFCLGFFTCILSIVRIKYLHIQDDLTWDNVDSGTWSMIEITSGVVCVNLATLRPLFKNIFPSLGGSTPSAPPGSGADGSGGGGTAKSRSAARGGWSVTSGSAAPASAIDDVERKGNAWELTDKASQDSIMHRERNETEG